MENGCATIPKERQRLLFNNQILQPDNSPIYWIAGVGADCKIHLGRVQKFQASLCVVYSVSYAAYIMILACLINFEKSIIIQMRILTSQSFKWIQSHLLMKN